MFPDGSQDGYFIIASVYLPTRFPFLNGRGYVKLRFLWTLCVYCWADRSEEKFTPNGFGGAHGRVDEKIDCPNPVGIGFLSVWMFRNDCWPLFIEDFFSPLRYGKCFSARATTHVAGQELSRIVRRALP